MAAQLVFDTPQNRVLFDKYKTSLINNPRWEPGGSMRYGKGIDTVNVNGVEYYKNVSYGTPTYYHNNEAPMRFKQVGGKKSQFVSDALNVLIDKGIKYGAVGSALGASILSGNPELAPIGVMLASDIAPEISSRLRKKVYDKTGYGYYGGADDVEDKKEMDEPVKKVKKTKKVKKNPIVTQLPSKNSKGKKGKKGLSEKQKAWQEKVKEYRIAHSTDKHKVTLKEALKALKK